MDFVGYEVTSLLDTCVDEMPFDFPVVVVPQDVGDAKAAARRLTEEAIARGSSDNVSCIVLQCATDSDCQALPCPMAPRLLNMWFDYLSMNIWDETSSLQECWTCTPMLGYPKPSLHYWILHFCSAKLSDDDLTRSFL